MPSLKFPDFNQIDWRDWKTYLALPVVLLVFALWKPLESLRRTVWNRSGIFGGLFHEVLALGTAAGIAATAHQTSGLPLSGWLGQIGEGIGAGFITWAYAFPIVWLVILRPAYLGLRYCVNHFDFVDDYITGPLMKLSPRLFLFMPGARRGWEQVKEDNWFVDVVAFIAYATGLLSSLYIGWQAQKFVFDLLPANFWIAQFTLGVSWAVALVVSGLLARIVYGALSAGKNYALGTLIGVALTYACSGLIHKLALLCGAPVWSFLAVFYALSVTYVLPSLYIIFASGFWKKLYKRIEPLYTSYFEGKDTAFRHVTLQSLALTLTLAIAVGALWACATVALNGFACMIAMALFLGGGYAILPKAIDQDYGNALCGIVGAIAFGCVGGFTYCHYGFVFGIYGGIATGVVSSIVAIAVIPLAYKACEWLANLPVICVATDWLGDLLPAMHRQYLHDVVEPFVDTCKSIYEDGYGRASSLDAKQLSAFAAFKKLSLHATNAGLTAILAFWTFVGLNQVAFLHAYDPGLAGAITALVALFSLGLLSRVVLRVGLELPGVVVSLLVGLVTAMVFMPATAFGSWVAVPAGVIAAAFNFGIVFPICLIVLRTIVTWAAPTLNIPLDWVANTAWWTVRGFWKGFCKLFDFVYDLFEPIWRWFGTCFAWIGRQLLWITAPIWRMCSAIYQSCSKVWKGIFGGR
ncbi:MAG: hypothetical protein P4L53_05115 [Candidatus Obscuribacterales bacterium]|nr:hypothetical protein [Candidatus Obscuribacterales bacterium]